jgi:hypothetical protein
MPQGAGIGSKLAIGRGTTWGVATNVNLPNRGIEYLSEDFGVAIPEYIDDQSVSRSWSGNPIYGNVSVNAAFRAYLRYLGFEYVLAQPLGAAQVSAVATGVFAHRYTYTSNITGIFATMVINKGFIHEYPSNKLSGYTLTMQAGRPSEIQTRGFGTNTKTSSQLNTSIANASFRTAGLHVLWSEMRLAVQARGTGAPSFVADSYQPSAFEHTYDRPLSQHWVMNGSREMIEPIIDGHPNVTARMTFPRYADTPAGTPANFFLNAATQNTAMKAWLRALGPTIPGTSQRYRMDVFYPNAFVQSASASVGGPAAIPHEVTITGKSSSSVPTGFPSWIGAGGFAIRIVSNVGSAPF